MTYHNPPCIIVATPAERTTLPEQPRTKPCPQCGERDATNRLEDLGHICNDCTLIFEGTAHEYAQWEYRRLAHRRQKGLTP